jgi:hypothetical protein
VIARCREDACKRVAEYYTTWEDDKGKTQHSLWCELHSYQKSVWNLGEYETRYYIRSDKKNDLINMAYATTRGDRQKLLVYLLWRMWDLPRDRNHRPGYVMKNCQSIHHLETTLGYDHRSITKYLNLLETYGWIEIAWGNYGDTKKSTIEAIRINRYEGKS